MDTLKRNREIKLLKDTAGIDLRYAYDLIRRFGTAEKAIEHLCSLEANTSPSQGTSP